MTLQHEWIKTQVRLPQDLHPTIKSYAKDNDLSMNTAILELIKKGLTPQLSSETTSKVEITEQQTISPKRYQELQQQVIDLSAKLLDMMTIYSNLDKKLAHLPDISPEEMHEFLEYRKNKPTS